MYFNHTLTLPASRRQLYYSNARCGVPRQTKKRTALAIGRTEDDHSAARARDRGRPYLISLESRLRGMARKIGGKRRHAARRHADAGAPSCTATRRRSRNERPSR